MLRGTCLTATIALLLLAIPAEAAAPSIYTIHKELQLPLAACMARAKAVVAANRLETTNQGIYSTYGFNNNYTIVIRCMPDQATLFVAAAGPELSECDRLANKVLSDF